MNKHRFIFIVIFNNQISSIEKFKISVNYSTLKTVLRKHHLIDYRENVRAMMHTALTCSKLSEEEKKISIR